VVELTAGSAPLRTRDARGRHGAVPPPPQRRRDRLRDPLARDADRPPPGAGQGVAISLPLPTELRSATDAEAAEARKALETSTGVSEVVRVARFEFGTIVEVPASVDIGALKVDTTTLVCYRRTLQLTPAPDLSRAVHHHPGFWGLGGLRGDQLARLRARPRHSGGPRYGCCARGPDELLPRRGGRRAPVGPGCQGGREDARRKAAQQARRRYDLRAS
jgi:hypothetical protein